jgi:hypothetical protein
MGFVPPNQNHLGNDPGVSNKYTPGGPDDPGVSNKYTPGGTGGQYTPGGTGGQYTPGGPDDPHISNQYTPSGTSYRPRAGGQLTPGEQDSQPPFRIAASIIRNPASGIEVDLANPSTRKNTLGSLVKNLFGEIS